MAVVPGTAPIVAVSDLGESIAFYTRCLGFSVEIGGDGGIYALLRRDTAMIALIKADDQAALTATRNNVSAQLWVPDVDACWSQVAGQVRTLPDSRWTAPHDRDYGLREFHVKDPDGFLMFFTQLPTGG